ncbi:MAG: hypothetical protein L6E13_01640 [Firmicutes bacterium]|nr:hypothetical protein [Bacillota bacterium]
MTSDQAAAAAGALVGLPWPEAEELLRSLGIPYRTLVTRPPGRGEGVGEPRVVGVRPGPDAPWLVILAYPEYRSGSMEST